MVLSGFFVGHKMVIGLRNPSSFPPMPRVYAPPLSLLRAAPRAFYFLNFSLGTASDKDSWLVEDLWLFQNLVGSLPLNLVPFIRHVVRYSKVTQWSNETRTNPIGIRPLAIAAQLGKSNAWKRGLAQWRHPYRTGTLKTAFLQEARIIPWTKCRVTE